MTRRQSALKPGDHVTLPEGGTAEVLSVEGEGDRVRVRLDGEATGLYPVSRLALAREDHAEEEG